MTGPTTGTTTGPAAGPATRSVRRVPPVDELSGDGERLVLVEDRAVRVVGVGPAVLDLTGDWITLPALAEQVAARHGVPAELDLAAVLGEAVEALAAEGLLEVTDGR